MIGAVGIGAVMRAVRGRWMGRVSIKTKRCLRTTLRWWFEKQAVGAARFGTPEFRTVRLVLFTVEVSEPRAVGTAAGGPRSEGTE